MICVSFTRDTNFPRNKCFYQDFSYRTSHNRKAKITKAHGEKNPNATSMYYQTEVARILLSKIKSTLKGEITLAL